jgi:hypothetical protein
MRVAVIVVTMLVVTTPSEASRSCMSKTEARQHFGSVHIYWHGPDHCWDATPTRRRHQIHSVVQRKNDQPKWHESMSEMLPDEEPVQTLGARTSWDARQHRNDPAAAGAPWVDRWVDIEPSQPPLVARWVDIVQVAPPAVIEREPEPMVSPRAMVLVFTAIVLALTLATIEVLFRCTIYELTCH